MFCHRFARVCHALLLRLNAASPTFFNTAKRDTLQAPIAHWLTRHALFVLYTVLMVPYSFSMYYIEMKRELTAFLFNTQSSLHRFPSTTGRLRNISGLSLQKKVEKKIILLILYTIRCVRYSIYTQRDNQILNITAFLSKAALTISDYRMILP